MSLYILFRRVSEKPVISDNRRPKLIIYLLITIIVGVAIIVIGSK